MASALSYRKWRLVITQGIGCAWFSFILVMTTLAADPAAIVTVTPTLFLDADTATATVFLTATDDNQVAEAFVEIRMPGQEPNAELLRKVLDPPVEGVTEVWSLEVDIFTTPGLYEIFYYVEDIVSGDISSAQRSVIYKDKADNSPPSAFTLLSPAAGATVMTILVFDWTDANPDAGGADPGDAVGVTYTLRIATDPDMTNIVHTEEGITTSRTHVDDSAGLADLATYYWQVVASDGYGARTPAGNGPLGFSTDNPNNLPSIFKGLVYSDASLIRLAGVNLSITVDGQTVTTSTEADGVFIVLGNAGTATLSASLAGYAVAEAGNITGNPGQTTANINLALTPAQIGPDSDGDGVEDSDDNCPAVANAQQQDQDGNGVGDACEPEDDGLFLLLPILKKSLEAQTPP